MTVPTRKVLLIAFHYPPFAGSSGSHRALKFSQYLPLHDWHPTVLTVSPNAYAHTSTTQLQDIPSSVRVIRAKCLDAARHFAVRKHYSLVTALPDRWSTWFFSGLWHGLNFIKREKPDALLATYPTATAQLIAYALHRLTGIPWIADLRDPMMLDDYPVYTSTRRVHHWLERALVKRSKRVIVTTPSAQAWYQQRYPEKAKDHFVVIPNGFDEEDFKRVTPEIQHARSSQASQHWVHAGFLYKQDRNPEPFFAALSQLQKEGALKRGQLRVTLRASGYDEDYQALIEHYKISQFVTLAPTTDFNHALQEILLADALILFQGPHCNKQIPAKAYEYLRAHKPILPLIDPKGDTADLLRSVGLTRVTSPNDITAIAEHVRYLLQAVSAQQAPLPDAHKVALLSRQNGVAQLADVLNEACRDV